MFKSERLLAARDVYARLPFQISEMFFGISIRKGFCTNLTHSTLQKARWPIFLALLQSKFREGGGYSHILGPKASKSGAQCAEGARFSKNFAFWGENPSISRGLTELFGQNFG